MSLKALLLYTTSIKPNKLIRPSSQFTSIMPFLLFNQDQKVNPTAKAAETDNYYKTSQPQEKQSSAKKKGKWAWNSQKWKGGKKDEELNQAKEKEP